MTDIIDERRVIQRWNDGETIGTLAYQFGTLELEIRHILGQHGVVLEPGQYRKAPHRKMSQNYVKNSSSPGGISAAEINGLLRQWKIPQGARRQRSTPVSTSPAV